MLINIKSARKCAICKYWYDPTNSVLSPKAPNVGLWEITDINKKCKCLKRNLLMPAFAVCGKDFESKF